MWVLICLILVHKVNSIATDYFDVTLVFEDSKFNQAHKVVLATSSTLRTHPSSNKFVGFHEDRRICAFVGLGRVQKPQARKLSVGG